MVHEVLYQSWCEPIFLNIWMVARDKNNSHIVYTWEYCLRLLVQHSWWLCSWSQVPSRNCPQKCSVSKDIHAKRYCCPACLAWPFTFATGRLVGLHLTGIFKPNEDYVLRNEKRQCQQKHCYMLQNLGRNAVSWYQLLIYSNSWR